MITTVQITSSGNAVTGKWGLCQDERDIIYDGSGAGQFCPMPFLYNREYYDTCTKKSASQPTGQETFYWCPNPNSVNVAQQNLFLAGGQFGKCNNFRIPPGKYSFYLNISLLKNFHTNCYFTDLLYYKTNN